MTLDHHILAIDIVSDDGTVISSTLNKISERKMSHFDEFLQLDNREYGDVYFRGPHHSSLLNRIDIDFAAPISLNRGEKPLGIIMIHYDSSGLNSIISNSDELKGNGEIYLVNENKQMLTGSKYLHGTFMTQSIDTNKIGRIRGDVSEDHFVYNNYRGVPVIGVAIDIPEHGWTLVVEVDKRSALVGIRKSGYVAFIIACVCIVISIGIGIMLFLSATRPVTIFEDKKMGFSDRDYFGLVNERRSGSIERETKFLFHKVSVLFDLDNHWYLRPSIYSLPFILNLFGIDFGSTVKHLDIHAFSEMERHHVVDSLHLTLSGSFTHTLLEWSAFCIAIFTVMLAFVHFDINRDITTPIIGLVLFFADMTDAFHTLAADRLVEAVADNRNLIPFTWAICRLFNALIMIVWIGVFLIIGPKAQKGGVRLVSITGVSHGKHNPLVWSLFVYIVSVRKYSF